MIIFLFIVWMVIATVGDATILMNVVGVVHGEWLPMMPTMGFHAAFVITLLSLFAAVMTAAAGGITKMIFFE